MPKIKPTKIRISGRVLTDKYGANAGDVYVYRKDDREGRFARAGRHANFGYSGYFLASIFDGESWRKLQFNKLVPYENRSYEQARECPDVIDTIEDIVSTWRANVAEYDETTRSFRLYHRELVE